MGIIRRPDTVKLGDVDTPVEEVICTVETSDDGNTVEIICGPEVFKVPEPVTELKPRTVITSTATGEQFGSWIPSLSASGIIEIDIRSANYTKVGQLVTCVFDIMVTNIIGGKKDSEIILNGLPSKSLEQGYNSGSVHVAYYKDLSLEVSQISGLVASNDTRASLWYQHHSEKNSKRLTQIDIKVGTVLVGTVTYISNS